MLEVSSGSAYRSKLWAAASATVLLVLAGCQTTASNAPETDAALRSALDAYRGAGARRAAGRSPTMVKPAVRFASHLDHTYWPATPTGGPRWDESAAPPAPTTQAANSDPAGFTPPEGYWRRNVWHQMGYEAKHFGGRGFWKGFETVFWDVETALVLTATMGASVAIRETGVDDAIRRRTHGSRQLGDLDEPIQLLGHPGTHFAATGALWLTSTLTKDVEQHEVSKALTKALAVNGVTTMALKAAANTEAPNGDELAWPSGHTSSAFTTAAVLNEYYGPWVGIPSLALAGLVGYQRIDSRVHDFSDVVFGSMLGYMVGTSIAREEQARFPELFGMEVVPFVDPPTGATGFALMKRW